ncbi:MAG: SAM-dependent methyltransferase, partial [Candidatus Parabeggiatoa sp.]|nr:SAM-dependent methyltransferase [Candidatus Parabeggiatoa sp.]
MHNLSSPSPETVVHSQRVSALIRKTINEAGGAIPFNKFMEQALYAPGLGYYSAGLQKLGVSGDFITAPEISPLFSHCVARQCQQVLATFEEGVILELGAGSGIMAAEILKELERLACLPKHYFILEVSADLQQRQRATLQAQVPNHLHCVQWLDSLPSEPIQGVILANEVLDAMPVQRFRLEEQDVSECYVSLNEFNEESLTESPYVWQYLPTRDASLRAAVEALRPNLPIGYVSEMNLTLPAWIQAIAESLAAGLVLLIDYGFPSHEYYHPQRDQGTLMCHYQHQAHDNPLILIGIQDITAHVDFTAVGESAESADLQVSGYSNQANFLLACGLPEMLSSLNYNDTQYYLQQTQQAKTLILP